MIARAGSRSPRWAGGRAAYDTIPVRGSAPSAGSWTSRGLRLDAASRSELLRRAAEREERHGAYRVAAALRRMAAEADRLRG